MDRRVDRRTLIRKSLAVGTVGYVAPMVVGAVQPVFAQGVSGAGSNCPTLISTCASQAANCTSGRTTFCFCIPAVGGIRVCVDPVCGGSCTTTANCPANFVCYDGSGLNCCIDSGPGNHCIPRCGTIPQQPGTGVQETGWAAA